MFSFPSRSLPYIPKIKQPYTHATQLWIGTRGEEWYDPDLQFDDVWVSQELEILDLSFDTGKHVLVDDFVFVDDLDGDCVSCERVHRA